MLEVRIRTILREICFLTLLAILSLTSQAHSYGADDLERLILTNRYVFLRDQSNLHQTGGIASVNKNYIVEGNCVLRIDFKAGTALFSEVDATAAENDPAQSTLDPNEIFAMTSLVGIVKNNTTIEFTGQTSDHSIVHMTATFQDDLLHLVSETVPPPDSADYFVFDLDALAQRKYSGGTGEPNEPYQISRSEDLITLGETPEDYDKHFIMTNDVNLAPTFSGGKIFDKAIVAPDTNDTDTGFQGISFAGVFDGDRHNILHMTIIGSSYLGLFGRTDYAAELKNIDIIDANIIGTGDYIGALTGYNRGIISKSFSLGSLSGNQRVGGLTGRNFGSITMSSTVALVTGNNNTGGLAADNYGTIKMSYSTGKVTSDKDAGGLVCTNYGEVNETYSSAIVMGNMLAGGLVASNWQDANVVSSFWDVNTSGLTISDGGIGNTKTQMQSRNTFTSAGWDFVGETVNGPNDIWWILEGKDYPRLWWQLPRDDFSDGVPEPLWFVYEIEPESAWLEEINGRLEVNTSGAMEDIDAIYAPYAWAMDANKPFAMQVDFHFSKTGSGDGRINIGVVPSLDPYAMQWAEFEVGTFDDNPFYLYEARDGVWVAEEVTDRYTDEGTLYVTYDPNLDRIYFSDTGYGQRDAMWAIPDLVRGRWQCDSVYLILSGGSEGGMVLTGEDAWLDNLKVVKGAIRQ